MLTVTRVALLTRHVDFTIKAKHALEDYKGSAYFVSAFTSVQNLLTFLETNEQDVAILDLTVRGVVPDKLIVQVRTLQPNIQIVVSPNHPAVLSALASLNLQGIIDIPMPTRKLLGFMKKLVATNDEVAHVLMPNPADTQNLGVPTDASETSPASEPNPEAEETFRRLAAEEPPMPRFEESATIADVVENFIALPTETRLDLLLHPEPDVTRDATPEPEMRSSLAAQILEAALDHSTPVNAVLNRVRERITADDGLESINREPDFLNALPPLEYSAATTNYHEPDAVEDANDLKTDQLEPIARSRPILSGDFPSLDDLHSEPVAIVPEATLSPEAQATASKNAVPLAQAQPNQDIAQLALTLTEMSLETAADAIVLVRDQAIAAYSGRLPRAEIDLLLPTLTIPWDEDQRTYIDFVRLDTTSTDYVLHGVRTEGGFILYLLFEGSVPISAIRRQGRKLGEVLENIPATATVAAVSERSAIAAADSVETSAPPSDEDRFYEDDLAASDMSEAVAAEAEVLLPFNFVWVLRDASNPLDEAGAQSLIQALKATLAQRTWQIRTLDVYSDFVYVRADVPHSQSANRAVRDAMRASAELLQPTTPTWANSLWADSYLVVPADRELNMDEIQTFIRFARA